MLTKGCDMPDVTTSDHVLTFLLGATGFQFLFVFIKLFLGGKIKINCRYLLTDTISRTTLSTDNLKREKEFEKRKNKHTRRTRNIRQVVTYVTLADT